MERTSVFNANIYIVRGIVIADMFDRHDVICALSKGYLLRPAEPELNKLVIGGQVFRPFRVRGGQRSRRGGNR